jgi:CRP-like cAMP-binding protein
MTDKSARIQNRILAALPRAEYNRLLPQLQCMSLDEGQVLRAPDHIISAVYFPNNSVISLLAKMQDHPTLVVDSVGCEGMVGIPLALGYRRASHTAVVQQTGTAMKMMAGALSKNMIPGRGLQRLLFRNIHARLSQAEQTIACERFHAVEARLAFWLVLTQDRVGSDRFQGTQACISGAVRVRRERLNHAAGNLRGRKLIHYSRGYIQVLDRKGLEAAACSCYAIQKQRCDEYLGH